MKVLALGGCGGMGRFAVRTILDFDFVTEVVVADRAVEAAESFARRCGSRVSAAGVDVTDAEGLRTLMKGRDVVLNTVGPFYRFGVPILQAAIDAGCHYFDLNDDWEPTLEMLELHQDAAEAGVTAVIGLGASPGITNLLAMKAAERLDSVDELLTGWSLAGTGTEDDGEHSDGEGPSAALVHFMHQCSGKIRVWESGRWVETRPVQERTVAYPGVGGGRVWTVGHPEAVTLPRTLAGLKNSANVMTGPASLMKSIAQIRDAIDAGELTIEEAAAMLSQPASEEMKLAAAEEVQHSTQLPPLFALAIGQKNGVPHRAGAMALGSPAGGMGGVTGIPLALGLPLLAADSLKRPGVFAPEAVVDPDAFFTHLAPYCRTPAGEKAFSSVADLVLVTEQGGS